MRHAIPLSILGAAALGLAALAPVPASAQVQDRVVIVYGDDPCPSSNGQAIVVCARKPETERYRIPKALREEETAPMDTAWMNKLEDVEYIGKSGPQSCTAEGAGGWSGCMKKILANARAEHEKQKKEENDIP